MFLSKKISMAMLAGLFLFSGSLFSLENIRISNSSDLKLDLTFRSYAIDDQRIFWSGLEISFGAEACMQGIIERRFKGGKVLVESEFFINQPFGENILTDEYREDYMANWEVDTFEMSKLNIGVQTGGLTIKFGKALTPFGRSYIHFFSNKLNFAAPFIRTEAILWRETGLFVNVRLKFLSFDIAAINGEENLDTNSGKGGIFRLGAEGKNWQIGASYKIHDGYGSEQQKEYKNHTGIDFMFRISKLIISGEWIWDEYGFHRPFDEEDITWPRSLYFRDIFYQYKTPIKGKGGYINLLYQSKKVIINLHYGEYTPQEIGNPYHDPPIKRMVGKIGYDFLKDFRIFFIGLIENQREEESWSSGAKPYALLLGLEYTL